MDTKERLKHASEVLGWLAEGKTIQLEMEPGVWETRDADSPAGSALHGILERGWRYRIKPEPVECVRIVASNGDGLMVFLPEELFKTGMRVKVTLLES